MTWDELISLAVNTAVAGTDADNNPIIKQRLEAAAMTDQAIHELSTLAAGNPELRSRLEKRFSLSLTSGVVAIPAGMLTEYLREGSVRDTDQSQFSTGNPYSRVKFAGDFFNDSQLLLGRYCLIDNSFYACPPGIADYTQFTGSIVVDAPFVPTAANLNTEVPDEVADDLIELLARRLRGVIFSAEAAK